MTETPIYTKEECASDRISSAVTSLRDKNYFKKIAGSFGFRDRGYIEDIVGDTIVEVLEHLRSNDFVERSNGIEGYLAVAFRRNCLDKKRKEARSKRKGNDLDIPVEDYDVACPKTLDGIGYLVAKESSEILFYEIGRLPDSQREQVLKTLNKTIPNRSRAKKTGKVKGNKTLRERLARRGVLELDVE